VQRNDLSFSFFLDTSCLDCSDQSISLLARTSSYTSIIEYRDRSRPSGDSEIFESILDDETDEHEDSFRDYSAARASSGLNSRDTSRSQRR